MKKIIAMLLSVVMVFGLVACSTGTETTTTTTTAAATTETAAAETTEAAPAEEAAAEAAPAEEASSGNYTIAVVPKLTSIAWFQRMEVGVNEYAAETGIDAFYTGPSEGDGALQAQYVRDLITQGVDAICIVPFDTAAVEPALAEAREAGIVVISHEAATMANVDYDIEAFINEEYGAQFMDRLGELTGGEGEYIQLVGALTSESHMQWVTAGQELAAEKYPNMTMGADLIETADDADQAYAKVKEALTANPNIVAIQGSAMPDVAGAARAVEEMGLEGKVSICGTSLYSVAEKYVESGTIDTIGFWDPAEAGKAMIQLAVMVLEGETIEAGIDLGVTGYENLTMEGTTLTGSAWIFGTADEIGLYDF